MGPGFREISYYYFINFVFWFSVLVSSSFFSRRFLGASLSPPPLLSRPSHTHTTQHKLYILDMVGRRSTIFPYISLKPFLSNFPVAPNILTQDDIKKKKRNECQRSKNEK